MYSGIKADIESVFQWLRGSDEIQWEAQIVTLSDAISDAGLMALPRTRPDKTGTGSQEPATVLPGTREIGTALPYLRAMLAAVQRRNRAAALQSGRAALSSLT